MEEIVTWKKRRYKVLILAGMRERGLRLASDLRERDIDVIYKDELDIELKEGHIVILPGILNNGFDFPSIKYAVISDREAFGSKRKTAEKKKGKVIDVFTDLKVGDFVVHENHGIGQYIGIEKLKIDNMIRDYLHIKYSGNDKLYIPTDQLDMIQKYIGSEDKGPKLNKLGGAEWVKVKTRAKKAIESMALDLLKLYAERQQAVGFEFSKDTKWQKEFEDMFPSAALYRRDKAKHGGPQSNGKTFMRRRRIWQNRGCTQSGLQMRNGQQAGCDSGANNNFGTAAL